MVYYTGDPNCFLFQLAPKIGVYLATGYNQNYMYLEQNAQTLPNGLVSEAGVRGLEFRAKARRLCSKSHIAT